MIRLFTIWRSLIVVGVIIAAASIASGCGDDDSNDDGTTSEASFTGPPVTIYTSAPIDTPIADAPEIGAGVHAAARAINEDGGLNGHEVKVEVCNDTDPNAEVACARKAVQDDALALSGAAFVYNAAAAEQALAKSKIANVADIALSPDEYAQPINFPIDMPIFGHFPCVTQAAAASGNKTVGTITQNLPVQVEGARQFEAVAKGSGNDYTGTVVVPTTQTDFSAPVQELTDNDTEVVNMFLFPAQIPGVLQAATSLGKEFVYCGAAGNSPVQVLEQLGAGAGEYYVGAGMPPTSQADKYPLMQEFIDQMNAEEESGNADASLSTGIPYHAMRAWLGVQVIKQASESVEGELNSASLLDALNKTTVDLGGITPPIDFSKPAPVPGFERAFNPTVILVKWDPDQKELVETDQQPQNGLELLAAAGVG